MFVGCVLVLVGVCAWLLTCVGGCWRCVLLFAVVCCWLVCAGCVFVCLSVCVFVCGLAGLFLVLQL